MSFNPRWQAKPEMTVDNYHRKEITTLIIGYPCGIQGKLSSSYVFLGVQSAKRYNGFYTNETVLPQRWAK